MQRQPVTDRWFLFFCPREREIEKWRKKLNRRPLVITVSITMRWLIHGTAMVLAYMTATGRIRSGHQYNAVVTPFGIDLLRSSIPSVENIGTCILAAAE